MCYVVHCFVHLLPCFAWVVAHCPASGPVTALSLDADPLANAPKPTLQQIEQVGERHRKGM